MSDTSLQKLALDLLWSLWSELGVPGVTRRHTTAVIDPELLIAVTPSMVHDDARLAEQVMAWCVAHGSHLSASRFRGLVRVFPETARDAFHAFTAQLHAAGGPSWPTDEASSAAPPLSRVAPPPLDLARPSLLTFRARALSGVGTRADVLVALLAAGPSWSRPADLDLGYTKRNVARVLLELRDANLVTTVAQGKRLLYRLASAEPLRALLGAEGLSFPAWSPIFQLMLASLSLVPLAQRPSSIRRIEAHAIREQLAPLARRLDLPAPPATRGQRDAYELVETWSRTQLTMLAAGSAAPFARANAVHNSG